jgi:hypothetical protein
MLNSCPRAVAFVDPSSAGAEFQTLEAPLEDPMGHQYAAAATTWNQLFREFLYAEEQAAAATAARAEADAGAPSGAAGSGVGRAVRKGRTELAFCSAEAGWHVSGCGYLPAGSG